MNNYEGSKNSWGMKSHEGSWYRIAKEYGIIRNMMSDRYKIYYGGRR